MTDSNFVLFIPRMILSLGIMLVFVCGLIMVLFTIFSNPIPHVIFYIIFGLFLYIGIYLILKTLFWKVVVKDDVITVFPIIRKPYLFTFNDIISVKRQVKKNQLKSEGMVIRTISGRKLIVESAEVSYKRFRERIKEKVKADLLMNFE